MKTLEKHFGLVVGP